MILELPGIENTTCGKELLAKGEAKGRVKGREEGRVEGHQEGRQEGRVEGRVLQLRDSLRTIAAHRFGQLPSDIAARIGKLEMAQATELLGALLDMADLEGLRRWYQERSR